MSSVLRPVRKRKKRRKLGSVEVLRREEYAELELDARVELIRSLKTTNCLESVNALVEERCAKVDHWQNCSQRHPWLATALLDIEPRLRKLMGYRHLHTLRAALKRALKIDVTSAETSAM